MFEEKSLKTLEYDKILSELSSYAQSDGGKAQCLSLRPFQTYDASLNALNQTAEADRALYEFSVNPSFAVDDVEASVKIANKGATLAIADLLRIARCLRIARRVEVSLAKVLDAPLLHDMCLRLYSDETFEKSIFDSFLSETEVADSASPELKSIRQRIRRINENIKTKLQSFISSSTYQKLLQDNIITMRGDRYVVPLKSEFKGQIPGLIHDQSASGSTLYVEPMQVVEMNNDLKAEKLNEQKEIERILKAFSSEVRSHSDGILWSYQTIVDMDAIFARAQLAHAYKAVRPELNRKGNISISDGRHPLIDQKKVVPISLQIGGDKRMLLITGPNTGGKTVTLKMVGLFALMAMSGLYIPAKYCEMSVFDGVYPDIGDEQSIEQSLSTFSAHMRNTIDILAKADQNSLVLFDELGSGTDPSEGAALAVSIAEYIMGVGAVSLVTSHFNDLKEFALVNNGVAAASMEFDTLTLSPTFRLVMGAIGTSNALDIASKLGLNKEIVDKARGRLSTEKKQFDNVLNAAEETRRHAEMLVKDAVGDRQAAAEEREEAAKEKRMLAEKREKLDESIRRETKHLIDRSVEEADDIIDELRSILDKPVLEEGDLFAARSLKSKLKNMSAQYDTESVIKEQRDETPANVGDSVFVTSLNKKGKLVKLSNRGEGEVAFGKIVMKVKKGDYYKVKDQQ